jgi:uncharacterized protein YdhG (YjbR/CyaY superfamily)
MTPAKARKAPAQGMQKASPSVPAYIAAAPAWSRPALRALRRCIRTAAPKAKESISYGMPYYSQDGRLAYFAAFKAHCSFYWVSAAEKKRFAQELSKLHVVSSTLRILQGEKVPVGVISKLLKARLKERSLIVKKR